MQFPLTFTFKLFALSKIISITDASGSPVCYVKQKNFRLKEKVLVYTDSTQNELLAEISADRILDWSAAYSFTDPDGNTFGSVKRRGGKSLWKATYEVFDDSGQIYTITEENPWAKIGDSALGQIPVLGILSAYLFHPRYGVRDPEGTLCYQQRKQPAMFEGKFTIEETAPRDDDIVVLMSLIMMTLLERSRG